MSGTTLQDQENLQPALSYNQGAEKEVVHGGSSVLFEYTGETALTIIGAVTQTRYRFIRYGERQAVDRLDAVELNSVPTLRMLP